MKVKLKNRGDRGEQDKHKDKINRGEKSRDGEEEVQEQGQGVGGGYLTSCSLRKKCESLALCALNTDLPDRPSP